MWLMSSRLITAPSSRAFRNSSAGVSFEVNMIMSPRMPTRCDSSSSASELQSAPKPSDCITFMMCGFGHALTAKYSRKSWRPREGLLQAARVLPHAPLVVEVERGRVRREDLLELRPGERQGLVGHRIAPQRSSSRYRMPSASSRGRCAASRARKSFHDRVRPRATTPPRRARTRAASAMYSACSGVAMYSVQRLPWTPRTWRRLRRRELRRHRLVGVHLLERQERVDGQRLRRRRPRPAGSRGSSARSAT